jgi:hypothetical protein
MTMQPLYRSAAFWTMLVGIVAQLLVGLRYQAEAEMLGTIAATVIAYLVSRGIVAKAVVEAESRSGRSARSNGF